jgi:hypothetical protein
MSKATSAIDHLAGEPKIEAPVDNLTLLMMVLGLAARVDALEAEASAKRQSVADEDMEPRPAGNWVSVKEAAYQANRSAAWIRKWRKRGEIAQHLEGGHVLVNLETVQRAIVRC